jgi:hypothetical protein
MLFVVLGGLHASLEAFSVKVESAPVLLLRPREEANQKWRRLESLATGRTFVIPNAARNSLFAAGF